MKFRLVEDISELFEDKQTLNEGDSVSIKQFLKNHGIEFMEDVFDTEENAKSGIDIDSIIGYRTPVYFKCPDCHKSYSTKMIYLHNLVTSYKNKNQPIVPIYFERCPNCKIKYFQRQHRNTFTPTTIYGKEVYAVGSYKYPDRITCYIDRNDDLKAKMENCGFWLFRLGEQIKCNDATNTPLSRIILGKPQDDKHCRVWFKNGDPKDYTRENIQYMSKGNSYITLGEYCKNHNMNYLVDEFNNANNTWKTAKDTYKSGEKMSVDDFWYAENTKVLWKCPIKGCEQPIFSQRISDRTVDFIGCPTCAAKQHQSMPEIIVYYYIKQFFPDTVQVDKKAIGMELDIYIPSIKTAIEYDGYPWHATLEAVVTDEKKDKKCAGKINLIRIREKGLPEIHANNTPKIVKSFKMQDKESVKDLQKAVTNILHDLGFNDVSIDIERDYNKIKDVFYNRKNNSIFPSYIGARANNTSTILKRINGVPISIGTYPNEIVPYICEFADKIAEAGETNQLKLFEYIYYYCKFVLKKPVKKPRIYIVIDKKDNTSKPFTKLSPIAEIFGVDQSAIVHRLVASGNYTNKEHPDKTVMYYVDYLEQTGEAQKYLDFIKKVENSDESADQPEEQ